MIKLFKSILFVVATIIMACCLLLVPKSSGPVSLTYIATLGIYLGLDIAGMISRTAALPKGEFKSLSVHKYVLASICLLTLMIISIFVNNHQNVETAITSYISSSLIIITCLLGGLEGNKIATNFSNTSENQKENK